MIRGGSSKPTFAEHPADDFAGETVPGADAMAAATRENRSRAVTRYCKGVIHLTGGLGAGLAIVLVMLAWQLSKGPVGLGFLTSYIERAINTPDRPYRVQLGDTILTWAGWERAVDIRVINVVALDDKNVVKARIPEIAFSLSGEALLIDRKFAPKSIELFGPEVRVRRSRDGKFSIGVGDKANAGPEPAEPAGMELAQRLLGDPEPGSPLAYLTRLNIIGAETVIADEVLGETWRAPAADIRLRRDVLGVQGEVTLDMQLYGRPAEVHIAGGYQSATRRLDVGVNFSEIAPATLARFHEALEPLQVFDLPFKGTVTLGMELGGTPEAVGFDLQGGAGAFQVPGEAAQRIPVEQVVLRGRYTGAGRNFEISELDIQAADGVKVLVPGTKSHRLPLASLKAAGRYSGVEKTAEVDRIDLDLRGPKVSAKGRALDLGAAPVISFEIDVNETPLDDLPTYWAPEWAPDARVWILENVSDGVIPAVSVNARLRRDESGEVHVDYLTGGISVTGATVDYLNPMPKIRNAQGKGTFTRSKFDMAITSGSTNGLTINKGRVLLFDLDTNIEKADIEVDISGALNDALDLIDHEPLGYASAVGVVPDETSGDASVRLTVAFPLRKDLDIENVRITADSEVRAADLPGALRGHDIANADLDLTIAKTGMEIKGKGDVGNIPVALNWRENFGDNVAFRTILDLSGKVTDIQQIRDLGLGVPIIKPEYIDGGLEADVRFTVLSETDTRVEIRADLSDARVKIAPLKWRKPKELGGRAEVNLSLDGDKVGKISHFAFYGGDMAAEGRALFDADTGDLSRIDFNQFSLGRTEMKGAVIRRADGAWDMGFHGDSLDLSAFWGDFKYQKPFTGNEEPVTPRPDMVLAMEFDSIWLDETTRLKTVSGTFARKTDAWETVLLRAELPGGGLMDVTLRPDDKGVRNLGVNTTDAGDFLRTIGLYDNMTGGELRLFGRFDDTSPQRPLTGRLQARNYRITGAPALAHVVSMMALTGIADVLRGEGLGFNILDIPFVKKDGLIEIRDAKAAGTSLGFTASGLVDAAKDELDLKGTIVPAYALNNALGRLPVLGDLLTGGESGSGLFAANFGVEGSIDEPDVSVNPLSALAPGVLRDLFGIFDGSSSNGGAESGGAGASDGRSDFFPGVESR